MVRASNQVRLVDDFTVIKEGDTVNSFVVQLLKRSGDPVDLSGANVTWIMANEKGVVLTKSANVTNASDGEITLDIGQEEQTGSGAMRVEITVENSGLVEKFPGHGYLRITISPSLGNLENTAVSFATIEYFENELQALKDTFLSTLTTEGETWEA